MKKIFFLTILYILSVFSNQTTTPKTEACLSNQGENIFLQSSQSKTYLTPQLIFIKSQCNYRNNLETYFQGYSSFIILFLNQVDFESSQTSIYNIQLTAKAQRQMVILQVRVSTDFQQSSLLAQNKFIHSVSLKAC